MNEKRKESVSGVSRIPDVERKVDRLEHSFHRLQLNIENYDDEKEEQTIG